MPLFFPDKGKNKGKMKVVDRKSGVTLSTGCDIDDSLVIYEKKGVVVCNIVMYY